VDFEEYFLVGTPLQSEEAFQEVTMLLLLLLRVLRVFSTVVYRGFYDFLIMRVDYAGLWFI
jgi:hypothetical protein